MEIEKGSIKHISGKCPVCKLDKLLTYTAIFIQDCWYYPNSNGYKKTRVLWSYGPKKGQEMFTRKQMKICSSCAIKNL